MRIRNLREQLVEVQDRRDLPTKIEQGLDDSCSAAADGANSSPQIARGRPVKVGGWGSSGIHCLKNALGSFCITNYTCKFPRADAPNRINRPAP